MSKLAVGMDLGGSNIRVALADSAGQIRSRLSEKTDVEGGPNAVTKQVVRIIREILSREEMPEIEGIGIGSVGPIDPNRGGIVHAPNIPYDFVAIVGPVEENFNVPVHFLNDCKAAAVAEHRFGAGKNCDNMVFVTISTGIGAGLYEGGRLVLGKDGNAGEVGCFTIDNELKLQCGCGRRGHWQAYTSGAGIPKYVRLLVEERIVDPQGSKLAQFCDKWENLSSKFLYQVARAGDRVALDVVGSLAQLNAMGMGSVINAYDPDILVVGGAIILNNIELAFDLMKPQIKEYAANRLPKIVVTPLSHDVVLYGAIAVVFEKNI